MAHLSIRRAGLELSSIQITSEGAVIGRDEGCDYPLSIPSVSRRQCRVYLVAGALPHIQNLSSHGTDVDGRNVTGDELLRDGAVISLPPLELVFVASPVRDQSQVATDVVLDRGAVDDSAYAPLATDAKLTVIARRAGLREVKQPWAGDTLTIGKRGDNGLVLVDSTVSDQHARLTRQQGRLSVHNLSWRNAVRVNGQRVESAPVALGDSIQIGETELLVVREGAPATPRARVLPGVIARSEAMHEPIRKALKVAPSGVPVLLLGPPGVGKGQFARAIHAASSRADRPFIPFDCATHDANLFNSALFGHEKHAFTGAERQRIGRLEEAEGGTLFFDEIGDLPLELQAHLLVPLGDREFSRVGGNKLIPFDVRIIAATNRDLDEMMAQGKFREDLYSRIKGLEIELPPLCQRGEDLDLLIAAILKEYDASHVALSPDARAALGAYAFPANVRELRQMLQYALVMREGDVIEEGDLQLKEVGPKVPGPNGPSLTLEPGQEMPAYLRKICAWTLAQCGRNKRQAANALGLSPGTFYKYLGEK